jgi:hypothetical protein
MVLTLTPGNLFVNILLIINKLTALITHSQYQAF